jgi:hypothetical protein
MTLKAHCQGSIAIVLTPAGSLSHFTKSAGECRLGTWQIYRCCAIKKGGFPWLCQTIRGYPKKLAIKKGGNVSQIHPKIVGFPSEIIKIIQNSW